MEELFFLNIKKNLQFNTQIKIIFLKKLPRTTKHISDPLNGSQEKN